MVIHSRTLDTRNHNFETSLNSSLCSLSRPPPLIFERRNYPTTDPQTLTRRLNEKKLSGARVAKGFVNLMIPPRVTVADGESFLEGISCQKFRRSGTDKKQAEAKIGFIVYRDRVSFQLNFSI